MSTPAAVPAAGDDRVLVDVEHVRLDPGTRVAAGEFVGVAPVRGTASLVEQPGLAQEEGPGADAQDPGATLHSSPQFLGQAVRLAHIEVVGRDADEVRRGQPLQAVPGPHLEAVAGRHAVASGRDKSEVVRGQRVVAAVDPEDLAEHAQLERMGTLEGQDGDVVKHGFPIPSYDGGRNFSLPDVSATLRWEHRSGRLAGVHPSREQLGTAHDHADPRHQRCPLVTGCPSPAWARARRGAEVARPSRPGPRPSGPQSCAAVRGR